MIIESSLFRNEKLKVKQRQSKNDIEMGENAEMIKYIHKYIQFNSFENKKVTKNKFRKWKHLPNLGQIKAPK